MFSVFKSVTAAALFSSDMSAGMTQIASFWVIELTCITFSCSTVTAVSQENSRNNYSPNTVEKSLLSQNQFSHDRNSWRQTRRKKMREKLVLLCFQAVFWKDDTQRIYVRIKLSNHSNLQILPVNQDCVEVEAEYRAVDSENESWNLQRAQIIRAAVPTSRGPDQALFSLRGGKRQRERHLKTFHRMLFKRSLSKSWKQINSVQGKQALLFNTGAEQGCYYKMTGTVGKLSSHFLPFIRRKVLTFS